MEKPAEMFLELYGHLPLTLDMLKSCVDMLNLSTEEFVHYLCSEKSCIFIAWYSAAIVYNESKDKQCLRQRCKGERLLRVKWREFLKSRVKDEPFVPNIPE